ncbi:MAG: alpha/beta hydrolase [Erysipelotrichaceae bacterium]|nr:alpha/beta hydrolase [Erysipelotrichaceae bacterium]MBQ1521316.1 alpha/beta hydrolase [Erysipelotrichaceae bacterium]
MELTENTTLREINECPVFAQAKGHLIAGWNKAFESDKSLSDLQKEHPTWNADDIIYGLNNLKRVNEEQEQYVFYPEDNDSDVCLFYLPAQERRHDTYFILLAGGAYGAVCTMIESLPVGTRLNELGFDVFCINYSVANQDSFVNGLMPEPLEDVSRCWKYIRDNEERFGLKAEEYILGGFSAGGHLAACYCLDNIGAKRYGAAAPKGLFLAYPLISVESIVDERVKAYMKSGLFGVTGKNDPYDYEIHEHVTSAFPRTYYVYCLDDDTIPQNNPSLLKEALTSYGVSCLFDAYENGGHGFGLGSKVPGTGYIERAIEFLVGE